MDDELLERARNNLTDRGVEQFRDAWEAGDDERRASLVRLLDRLESRDSEAYY